MNKRLQGFIIGFIIAFILLLNLNVFAESINVLFNVVNIKINGTQVAKIGDSYTLSNGEKVPFSISYKGTTYLPMRKLAELLGKEVTWDDKTKTANINDKTKQPTEESKTSTSTEYIFDLTDDEIKEAIELGKKGVNYILNYEDEKYKLIPNQSVYNIFIDELHIITPYLHIMRNSAMKAYKYETYSFDDAKSYLNLCRELQGFYFDMVYNCSKIDSHKNLNIVLKQGDKIIKPFAINGRDTLADMTDNWPDFPAYQALLSITFSNELSKEIDFSKKAQLIVIHAPEMESVFEIDFSKYK